MALEYPFQKIVNQVIYLRIFLREQ
jgi:hypothetical protein